MPIKKYVKKTEPLWKTNDFKAEKKGQRHTVYSINGDHYTGEWDRNKRNGKGTQFFKKKCSIYDGDWSDDLRHGFGTYSLVRSDGVYKKAYAGGWKDDKKHGHGIYYYNITDTPTPDTSVPDTYYEGEWKADMRSGWGRMYYSDGSTYEGEWLNDMRNGCGMLRFGNENRYEGEWKDDLKHGDGKYFYLDKGQVLFGTWVNDVAKCGEMKDFNRETAHNATQYPIPQLEMADPDGVLVKASDWFKSSTT